jgi:hypothetical protein
MNINILLNACHGPNVAHFSIWLPHVPSHPVHAYNILSIHAHLIFMRLLYPFHPCIHLFDDVCILELCIHNAYVMDFMHASFLSRYPWTWFDV